MELARRFLPVVVGARVGDAMGAPTEGLSSDDISRRFGWVDGFTGDGTDDPLMATLLADALLASGGHAGADEWAAEWVRQRDRMMARRDRFFPSVLHIAEKLAYRMPPRRVAAGTMPSSSSAMCIWPVGLVNAGNPRAAAAQAYSLAALIHVGEVDFCQDAADSRETVPAAFALTAMAGGDVRRGVELAANLGRDTDTIASMTGALCGAVGEPDAIPEGWVAALGPTAMRDAEDLACRLAQVARAKAAEHARLSQTVPGLTDG
jgi:ADP-ribosylglycohydrolase